MKRLADLVLAAALLVLLSPVFAALMVTIPLRSSGPAIFAQPRVGRHEKAFTCLKFRTMYAETPERPSHEVARAHVTPLGMVLRKYKLDELPQLVNVLRGEMSFVGPRPCLLGQAELIQARRRLGVFDVRPGITGLAQIRGVDMSDPERLARLDASYVANRSLAGDFRIMLATLGGSGTGDRTA